MRSTTVLAAVVAALGLVSSAAHAGQVICIGYVDDARIDDLVVPAGETCVLDRARVRGNVTVERDATLEAQATRIGGNLQADGADSVRLAAATTVRGNVQIRRASVVSLVDARIDGNVQLTGNRGQLRVGRSAVGGNMQLIGNRGELSVSRNRVGGNLQCEGNRPELRARGNRVEGNRGGQCDRYDD